MDITTVTEKGQATIPAKYREVLGIKPKDKVIFSQNANGDVVIRPIPKEQQDWSRFTAFSLHDELNSPADEEAYGDL